MEHYSTTKFTTRLIELKLTTVEALLNGHSRKRTALLMAAMHHKTQFFSTPIQSQSFYIPVNDQLHLRTPFYRPRRGCPLTKASTLYVLFTYLMLVSGNTFNEN